MAVKTTFLDKLIGRIDRIDPQSLQGVVLKLSREKGFLETLFNTIQEGILVTDSEGRIRYVNTAASELLGIPLERGGGEPIARYVHDLDWQRIWSAAREEWHKVASHELEVFYPRHRFLNFYLMPLVDDDHSTVSGLAVILRDATESRQQAESHLEMEKLSALTLLAAGVAHELGNPLNSLHIRLQLMERDLKGLPAKKADRLRNDLRAARDEIGRLDQIINHFLRAIRPTQPDLQPASINDVLTETLEGMRQEISDRDILLEKEWVDALPRLLVDRAQLKQAFYNIVKNALQAMGSGGILRVRSSGTDTHVMITFTDTGRGITAEEITRIFEPYYTTKTEGSGLGLMIVQRIVREHGGTIEVESNAGRGTTFRILLPLQERRMRLLKAAPEPAIT